MNTLHVYLNEVRVGRLDQDDSGILHFAYDPAWIGRPGAIPLSRSLPLQADVFSGKRVRSFFAGILPEEGPRKQVAKILGISDTNDFALLERIGGECAGAVSLYPDGVSPSVPPVLTCRALAESELIQIVMELPRRPLMAGREGLRLSLAGAQDKLPVVVRGNEIALPLGSTPSTHILKPEPDRFPGLADNELFCMSLARAVGLPVPDVAYRLIGGKPCLLVQRYDRATDERGVMTRIHQEDFCQALGYPPERKYQAEGGPALRDCLSLLRDWSTAPVLDIPSFADSVIFHVLIGNADAHGKNYALLYSAGERRLAPFYDLVSTLIWPDLSAKLAMKIGSADSINAFAVAEWKKMAGTTHLGWPLLRERMSEMSRSVQNALDGVRRHAGGRNEEMAARLQSLIGARTHRMLDALAGSKR